MFSDLIYTSGIQVLDGHGYVFKVLSNYDRFKSISGSGDVSLVIHNALWCSMNPDCNVLNIKFDAAMIFLPSKSALLSYDLLVSEPVQLEIVGTEYSLLGKQYDELLAQGKCLIILMASDEQCPLHQAFK